MHIFQQKKFSYAILRGIETKILERQQGFSYKTMTRLCQELLTDLLIKRLILWVDKDNTAAKTLYEKLGFIRDSEIYATYCDFGSD